MPAIYALRGVANTGKTTTIRRCYQMLLEEFPRAQFRGFAGRVEINGILIINNILIGIKSQGDPGTGLTASLASFRDEGCDIIICATRTSGETVRAVQAMSHHYTIIWRNTIVRNDRHEQDHAIAQEADWVVNQVRTALAQ